MNSPFDDDLTAYEETMHIKAGTKFVTLPPFSTIHECKFEGSSLTQVNFSHLRSVLMHIGETQGVPYQFARPADTDEIHFYPIPDRDGELRVLITPLVVL